MKSAGQFVAERLYYQNSALTEFKASVTDVREYARKDGVTIWQAALDRTAFYPTSGGQPYDTGKLTLTSKTGASLSLDVFEVTEDEQGEVWHHILKPLPIGDEITGSITFDRRADHRQQHTGQHLLSAIILRELQLPTVSFHLGDTSSSIDLAGEPPTATQLRLIETQVNQAIRAAHPIRAIKVTQAEAQALLVAGSLRKLPPREGDLRLVEIEQLDLNACGGTHLASTAELGVCLLRGTQALRQGTRLEFLFGDRAVAAARTDYDTLKATAEVLSVSTSEAPAAATRLTRQLKEAGKALEQQQSQTALYEAQSLIAAGSGFSGTPSVFTAALTPAANYPSPYLRLLAKDIASTPKIRLAVLCADAGDGSTIVMVAAPKGGNLSAGELLSAELKKLELRGGGSPVMAEGRVPAEQAPALVEAICRAVSQ